MTDRPHILALDHIASIQDPIRVTDNSGNPHLHYSAQHVKAAFLAGAASLPPATDPAISGLSSFPPNWKLRQMHFSAPCADDRKWHVNVYGGREGGDTFVGRGASADQALRDAARNARAALEAAPTIPATGEGGRRLYFPGLTALGEFSYVEHSSPTAGQITLVFKSAASVVMSTAGLEAIWPPKRMETGQ